MSDRESEYSSCSSNSSINHDVWSDFESDIGDIEKEVNSPQVLFPFEPKGPALTNEIMEIDDLLNNYHINENNMIYIY